MPKVSIVIPVYNTETYLDRCLQSVKSQTEKDWECILVDDGSIDKSGDLCDKYADMDRRFRAFHRTNHGPSNSRNFGIDIAVGKYICFIDSDDYVSSSYLTNLITPMEQSEEVKMTVTGMQKFGASKGRYPKTPQNIIVSSTDAFNNLLGGTSASIKGWLCNKCLRKDLLKGLRMEDELKYCEDLEFLLRVLYMQPEFRIAITGDYDYFYFIHNTGNSLSHNVRNRVTMMDKFNESLSIYPDSKYKRLRLVRNAYNQCRSLPFEKKIGKEDLGYICKAINVFGENIRIAFSFLSKKDFVQIVTIMLCYRLYYVIKALKHKR